MVAVQAEGRDERRPGGGGTSDDAVLEAVRQVVWFLAGHATPQPAE